jgi:hypothetical protein
MKRAQPIGIPAAPNIAGQARGEGERMAGSLYQSAAPVFVPHRDAGRLGIGFTPR